MVNVISILSALSLLLLPFSYLNLLLMLIAIVSSIGTFIYFLLSKEKSSLLKQWLYLLQYGYCFFSLAFLSTLNLPKLSPNLTYIISFLLCIWLILISLKVFWKVDYLIQLMIFITLEATISLLHLPWKYDTDMISYITRIICYPFLFATLALALNNYKQIKYYLLIPLLTLHFFPVKFFIKTVFNSLPPNIHSYYVFFILLFLSLYLAKQITRLQK